VVEPGVRAILRSVLSAERRLEGTDLTLLPGTATLGHFLAGRAYTVYAFSKDRAVLGYYCSIADEVSISPERIEYLDLVVDVLIRPSGDATVLDEDELPEDLDPRHRKTINTTLEELTGNTRRVVAEVEEAVRAFR